MEIEPADLRDPEAIANWPLTLSRDGARTPMPWAGDSPGLGFSTARPWLPFGADHAALAVDRQEAHEQSSLHLTRRLLALRNREPALRLGGLQVIEASETLLVLARNDGGQRLLCAFNFGDGPITWPADGAIIEAVNGARPGHLPAFGGLIVRAS